MRHIFYKLSFFIVGLMTLQVYAAQLSLDNDTAVHDLKLYGEVYFNYKNVPVSRSLVNDKEIWHKADAVKQKPKITSYSKLLKLDISNTSSEQTWYISFGYARLPLLRIYEVSTDSVVKVFELQPYHNYFDRKIDDPQLYVPVKLEQNSTKTLLIEYQTFANAPANIRLHNYSHYLRTSQQSTMVNGAISGIVFAILLIILVNLFFNPNKTNVFYALWTFTFFMIVVDMAGFTSKYIWPHLGAESSKFSIFLMTTVPILHILFLKSFLQLQRYHKKLNITYKVVLALYTLLIPLSLWLNTVFFNLVLSSLIIPLFLYTVSWSWNQKAPGIRVFSLSLFNHVLFVNIFTIVGTSFGNIFPNFAIADYIKVGYLLEVCLFTIALAIQNKSLQNQFVSYLQEQVGSLQENLSEEKLQHVSNINEVKIKEEQLFADLSHELRTPLTVMKIQVESLQHNIVDNVHLSYGKLMNKIDELNGFIDNLMKVTPSGEVYKNPNIKTVNIKGLLSSIKSIHDSSNTLSITTPDVMTYDVREQMRCFDYDQEGFKIVLEECYQNASSHGGAQVAVSVHVDNEEDEVVISIDNSGSTINEEDFNRIFSPLVRLDGSRQNEQSHNGMGLSLCKKIIESSNGQIFAANSKLGGLAIHVIFPLKA
ncbi:histidine kinase [Pseudoalteromonas phenolica]|uniref:histidine kinase n=2 Tax=Pseudoalteromonas phenolica TaxID=161398 RepID=A0A4Q7IPW5_9GAMM|nr:histidine kinase [Pseudoalteromonas phenolica]